jgi:hypothetical protein
MDTVPHNRRVNPMAALHATQNFHVIFDRILYVIEPVAHEQALAPMQDRSFANRSIPFAFFDLILYSIITSSDTWVTGLRKHSRRLSRY